MAYAANEISEERTTFGGTTSKAGRREQYAEHSLVLASRHQSTESLVVTSECVVYADADFYHRGILQVVQLTHGVIADKW